MFDCQIFMKDLWKKESDEYIDFFENERRKSSNWKKTEKILKKFVPIEKVVLSKSTASSKRLHDFGTKFLDDRNLTDAMDYYNKSLCYAKPNSIAASLAYCYRAVCFYRLGMYFKCLKDIELARLDSCNVLPDHQMSLLRKYQQHCLKELGKRDRINEIDEKLSFDSHTKYPGMADVLEIKTNEQFGRHVVAKCDIGIGETVLMEKHFVKTMPSSKSSCETCSKSNMNFIACDSCTRAMFCDEQCKSANRFHRFDCNTPFEKWNELWGVNYVTRLKHLIHSIILAVNLFPNENRMIKFVEDALIDRKAVPSSLIDSKSKYRAFLSLHPSHVGVRMTAVYSVYKQLCSIGSVTDRFGTRPFLMHLIATHLLILHGNAFTGDEEGASVGIVASFFNHSCAPNLINQQRTKFRCLTTMRPVKKGDQLFISYAPDADGSTEERRKHLRDNFRFECHCDKCDPQFDEAARQTMQIDPKYKAIRRYAGVTDNNWVERTCAEFLNEYGHLPWSEELEHVTEAYERVRRQKYTPMPVSNRTVNYFILTIGVVIVACFCTIGIQYLTK